MYRERGSAGTPEPPGVAEMAPLITTGVGTLTTKLAKRSILYSRI